MKTGMILDNSFPPDPRVENEAVSLIENGHEVYLFCLDFNDSNYKEKEVISGINIRRYHVNKFIYKLSALAYTTKQYHNVLKKFIYHFLTNNEIEAIHIHDVQIARAAFRANEDLNLPVILDLHENRPEIMKHYAHVKSLKGKLLINPKNWRKYEYKYLNQSDFNIVVTEEAKKHYLSQDPKLNPDKFAVVPNTVRKAFYSKFSIDKTITEKYKDNFVILYVGDTGARRGLKTVVKSIPLLKNEIPNVKFVFVGKSKSDLELKATIKELRVEKYVDMTGWQNFNLFQSYISASHIGISPLHKNIHHNTTYANKMFQYLAFGKPVIVSNCKAQQNIIEKHKCGLVFTEKSASEFASAVLQLFNDKKLYETMSQNGKRLIENQYNWENTSKELINIYNKIDQKPLI